MYCISAAVQEVLWLNILVESWIGTHATDPNIIHYDIMIALAYENDPKLSWEV